MPFLESKMRAVCKLLVLAELLAVCTISLAYSSPNDAYPTGYGDEPGACVGSSDGLRPLRREVYEGGQIFDITHQFNPNTPVGTDEGIGKFLTLVSSMKNGSDYNFSELRLGVHAGTHVDAPGHMFEEYYDAGFDVDSLDLRVLNGPALLVDVPRDKNLTAHSLSFKEPKMAEKNRLVTVAALQFACTDDVSTNVATAERLVRAAHQKGANIILIQELFEGYYFCQAQKEEFFHRAKPYQGHPTIVRMQNLAKELGVVIPVSFFEEANNAHYNSVAVIDADGTDLGLYRKSHIPDGPGYQEKFYFNPGDTGFKVFQTKYAKIGVAICWDQWFPEAARAMALQGAEVLFYPTAIGSEPQDDGLDSRDHWRRVMQGHAGANVVPLVASNRIGKEIIETEHGNSEITFYGYSFIAGPTGELVAAAGDKEEAVLVAQFDLDKIKSKRHSWGVYRDRRPDLYKVLLTLDGSNPVK